MAKLVGRGREPLILGSGDVGAVSGTSCNEARS